MSGHVGSLTLDQTCALEDLKVHLCHWIAKEKGASDMTMEEEVPDIDEAQADASQTETHNTEAAEGGAPKKVMVLPKPEESQENGGEILRLTVEIETKFKRKEEN